MRRGRKTDAAKIGRGDRAGGGHKIEERREKSSGVIGVHAIQSPNEESTR
jgi:hypothetical protein